MLRRWIVSIYNDSMTEFCLENVVTYSDLKQKLLLFDKPHILHIICKITVGVFNAENNNNVYDIFCF